MPMTILAFEEFSLYSGLIKAGDSKILYVTENSDIDDLPVVDTDIDLLMIYGGRWKNASRMRSDFIMCV